MKLIDHPQIAVAGGFGHAGCVFDELLASPGFANLCGMAPAYNGESLAGFLGHPWMKDVQIFDKVDDMLSRAQPDVLIVSTRPDKIFFAAMAGLARGCHLILEKPVALNFENLATLQGTADKASLRIMAMLSMRSFPTFIEARDQIAKGAIIPASPINGGLARRGSTIGINLAVFGPGLAFTISTWRTLSRAFTPAKSVQPNTTLRTPGWPGLQMSRQEFFRWRAEFA